MYKNQGELLRNEGEGVMGEGEEEAGSKTQGQECETGREGGLRGTGAPAPSMYNLEAGGDCSSLTLSQFTVPGTTAPIIKITVSDSFISDET